jgi:hypothetical protein
MTTISDGGSAAFTGDRDRPSVGRAPFAFGTRSLAAAISFGALQRSFVPTAWSGALCAL